MSMKQQRNPAHPKEAYCGACRKWKPIAEYAWGTYKCKACIRVYNRKYNRVKRLARTLDKVVAASGLTEHQIKTAVMWIKEPDLVIVLKSDLDTVRKLKKQLGLANEPV